MSAVTLCTCTVITGGTRVENLTCPIHAAGDGGVLSARPLQFCCSGAVLSRYRVTNCPVHGQQQWPAELFADAALVAPREPTSQAPALVVVEGAGPSGPERGDSGRLDRYRADDGPDGGWRLTNRRTSLVLRAQLSEWCKASEVDALVAGLRQALADAKAEAIRNLGTHNRPSEEDVLRERAAAAEQQTEAVLAGLRGLIAQWREKANVQSPANMAEDLKLGAQCWSEARRECAYDLEKQLAQALAGRTETP